MLVLVFPFVDKINAESRKSSCQGVLQVERFAQTQTRGDSSHHGYQRIVYGYAPHRIATEQLVVEGEANGGDGDEQQQTDDAEYVDMG